MIVKKTAQVAAARFETTCITNAKNFKIYVDFATMLATWFNKIIDPKYFQILANYFPVENKSKLRNLEERCRVAESLNNTNSLLFAKTCHELRTPLTAILGIAEIILENPENDKCLEWVQKIGESGNSLLRTLNDILDISKLEAGKFEFERVAFSPESIANQTVDLFRPMAHGKGVEISLNFATNFDGLRQGDSHRLGQVLNNIIGNSIKFTANGYISVSVENFSEMPLKISIRDTGIGMSEEQVNRIFNEYEQFDINSKRRLEGTGLGMSIVRGFVSQMGGEILISSVIGEGTLTQLSLPLPSIEDTANFQNSSECYNDIDTKALNGLRVLVVDDCVLNSEILSSFLIDAGVEVTLVHSGLKAVEICGRMNFDVIFVDINLPDISGVSVQSEIFQLRKLAGMPHMKSIAFTANAGSEDVKNYLSIGFDSHLGKPFRKSELLKNLIRIMAV